jgi:glucokinase
VVDEREVAGRTVDTSSLSHSPVEQLVALVSQLVEPWAPILGVGIGASGPVDLHTGVIHNPDTLVAFDGLNVAAEISDRMGVPAWIDNDSVVAGLAEIRWGQHPDSTSLACVTLGTGIGAVVISNGIPFRSMDGQHPEAGHIPVPGSGSACYCGLSQCWEQVASRAALERMQSTWSGAPEDLWRRYSQGLASGLLTLTTLFHPPLIVLGGSVVRYWSDLEEPLNDELKKSREWSEANQVRPSILGDRAGALGASLLPQMQIGWSSR